MSMDTHEYVKRLERAGITRDEAEAHIEALTRSVLPGLASKQDLTEAKIQIMLAVAGIISIANGVLYFSLK